MITIAPRYIPAYEVEIFFVLETILGPIWVWLFINEQPTNKTIIGGAFIIIIIFIHYIFQNLEKKKKINSLNNYKMAEFREKIYPQCVKNLELMVEYVIVKDKIKRLIYRSSHF